jgi:hypothetical protein
MNKISFELNFDSFTVANKDAIAALFIDAFNISQQKAQELISYGHGRRLTVTEQQFGRFIALRDIRVGMNIRTRWMGGTIRLQGEPMSFDLTTPPRVRKPKLRAVA